MLIWPKSIQLKLGKKNNNNSKNSEKNNENQKFMDRPESLILKSKSRISF